MRKIARIFSLALGLACLATPALAQTTCGAIPALPDTERRTEYTISASTGPLNVGFQLYGDSTDYANWVEVWVAGVKKTAVTDYTVTSPSGTVGTICRPITDAQVTFTAAQTGTVEIVGARRPRRASQVSENRGVTAHDFNQIITDMTAQLRERWDAAGRAVRSPPGETLSALPAAASRINGFMAFGATGDVAIVSSGLSAGTMVGPNPTVPGQTVTWNSTNGTLTASTLFSLSVKSFGAVGDGATDDTTAIRNTIAAVAANGGGVVFFPPGNFLITSTLNIAQAGTCLVGSGVASTNLLANTDFTMIAFAANQAYSCLEKIGVYGFRVSTATSNLVTVGVNSLVNMRDCLINGGIFGLSTAGVDGQLDNCAIAGWGTGGGNVFSTGANWYKRCKFDQGAVVAFGFRQGAPPALAENHFDMCDFSGSFSNSSFSVDDGGTARNVTVISGSVFSSPIVLSNAKHTSIIGGEIGSTTISNAVGSLSIVGTYAFSPTTATGAGTRSCAGNINITC